MAASSVEMVCPFKGDKENSRSVWSGGQERARNKNRPIEARRNIGMYTPYLRRDTYIPLTKTPKEILAMEGISFPEPPPLIGSLEKQNLNKFCDYHRDRGHNTNDWGNQKSGNQIRNNVKVINMIAGGRNCKRPYEEERSGLTKELTFPAIP
nr:reverse transcriptase domain-containing protein [Tanacetum cinerariifolium]GEZ35321.1 reverse transcriptase domain-containing protein [Tanacetum cinerariifolium]